MKINYCLLLFVLVFLNGHSKEAISGTIKVCSWNLMDFGKTKSEEEIAFIANTVNPYDIVMIQEVVAGDPGGGRAIARLTGALNRKGSAWEYRISEMTSGA